MTDVADLERALERATVAYKEVCAERDRLQAENDRLTQENWQLKQACGYPIPADKETPQNPFRCGTCEARSIEIDRLREELQTAEYQTQRYKDALDKNASFEKLWEEVSNENDRLREALGPILTAHQERTERLHTMVLEAREAIRPNLEPDSPAWLREAFDKLHAVHHGMGGDPFDMHIRAALAKEAGK